jgi:hypothetical protein
MFVSVPFSIEVEDDDVDVAVLVENEANCLDLTLSKKHCPGRI